MEYRKNSHPTPRYKLISTELPLPLLRRLRLEAAHSGRTMKAVINAALYQALPNHRIVVGREGARDAR